jgi:hypothetical protein
MIMNLPMIFGIGSASVTLPAIATAIPFRASVQTQDGAATLSLSFEAAKELLPELQLYVTKYSAGR